MRRAAWSRPAGLTRCLIWRRQTSVQFRESTSKHPGEGPFISPSCPAVLRFIQVKYPSMLHVIPCEAPWRCGMVAKAKVERPNAVRNPAAIFISPCPAKITASRQPVGRGRSLVDAAVSASEAYLGS